MLCPDENENRGFLPGTDGYMTRRSLTFEEGSINGGTQAGMEFENVALFCKVGGVPSPTVHWLKDGKRISQVRIIRLSLNLYLE